MLEITPSIQIDEHEIEYLYVRSPGPGGQNINKVSSTVQLRFNALESSSLPEETKKRLVRLVGKRMTAGGILIIEARQYRSQEKNRQAAQERLKRLIRQAHESPKPRHKTKPTHASVTRRLESKRKRGETKRLRRDTEIDG